MPQPETSKKELMDACGEVLRAAFDECQKHHAEDLRLANELYYWGQALIVNNDESDPDFDEEYEHCGGLGEDMNNDTGSKAPPESNWKQFVSQGGWNGKGGKRPDNDTRKK